MHCEVCRTYIAYMMLFHLKQVIIAHKDSLGALETQFCNFLCVCSLLASVSVKC